MTTWRSSSIAPGRFRISRLDWARISQLGPSEATSALLDRWVRFDGSYGAVGTSAALAALTAFTVEGWIRPQGLAVTGRNVFHRFPGIFGSGPQPVVRINAAGQLEINDFTTPGNGQAIGTTVMAANVWRHFSATYDGSGDTEIIVDGISEGVGSVAPDPFGNGGSFIFASSGFYPRFVGDMAQLRVWSVARTPAEVSADYQQELTGAEPNLVAYWPMRSLAHIEPGVVGPPLGPTSGNEFVWLDEETAVGGFPFLISEMGPEETVWT